MENKIREIQPMVAETWIRNELFPQEASLVQPVPKGDKSTEAKVDKEEDSKKEGAATTKLDPEKAKEIIGEVESYFEDFNIQLNYTQDKKTGDLVVKVLDRGSGEVIRQLPPEGLLKLREKLKELRGVLFDGKV